MSLFGYNRDFEFIKSINNELLKNVIDQKIGYYKIDLEQSSTNIYDEAMIKKYFDPVLLNCLIERGDTIDGTQDYIPDIERTIKVRLLRHTLVEANVFPEVGDIVLWNENYFEVTNKNENQLFVGKDPSYSYSTETDDYGGSLSIILDCHYKRPDSLGLRQERL